MKKVEDIVKGVFLDVKEQKLDNGKYRTTYSLENSEGKIDYSVTGRRTGIIKAIESQRVRKGDIIRIDKRRREVIILAGKGDRRTVHYHNYRRTAA